MENLNQPTPPALTTEATNDESLITKFNLPGQTASINQLHEKLNETLTTQNTSSVYDIQHKTTTKNTYSSTKT